MNEIKFSELDTAIKNNSYNFYNIYNSDLNLPIYYAVEHYINNSEDTTDVDQKLHIIFLDIEVYWKDKSVKFEFDVSDHPINAITIYSTEKKIFKSFYLLYDFNYKQFGITENCNIDELYNNHISKYKEWLLSEKYMSLEEDIEISVYNNETQLLIDVWKYIRETNPICLSSFNGDNFDYPYIYRRMLKLWNDDKLTVDSIISQFKQVDFQQNGYLKIIDYPICDLQFLYRPRDDGGNNLGKKLASYSLDFISDEELGLTKLEYKTKNVDIHEFYENDPINYLLYNIADVCLCVRLNEKLKHIELQNLIRRNMKLGFSQSMIGSSALYDSYVLYELHKKNYKIRHGIVTEMGKEIVPEKLSKIPTPQTKNNKVKADKISKQDYSSIVYRFEGAYVKESTAKIVNTGVVIDLDASLPPDEKIFIRRDGLTFWNNIGDYIWRLNDETLTWNDKNETVWRKVLGKISHPWTKDHGKLLKFTTKSGKTVTVTDNHSVFCIQKNNGGVAPYIVNAKELKNGDYLVGYKLSHQSIHLKTIVKIEEIDYNGEVYDISVEETERFFAGSGLGVHNSSLYPSMIRQYNIGFDTYRARIISPLAHKTLNILGEYIGKKPLPSNLFANVYGMVDAYIEREGAQNKTKAKNNLYYIISYHIYILSEKGIPLTKLFNPSNDHEAILLKHYLIPLLDIIDTIHINHESYNEFIYDYIFDPINDLKSKYQQIYLINNTNSPSQYIEKLDASQLLEKTKNLVLTINGACFTKHEDYLGLFVNFLTEMGKLRKQYRKLASEFPRGSEKYDFYNSRQLAIKVLMNSAYGVYGLRSFRYSNNHLAQSITSNGKLTIKLAQYLANKYVSEFEL